METCAQTEGFDKMAVGAPPPGWKTGGTGKGAAKWTKADSVTAFDDFS